MNESEIKIPTYDLTGKVAIITGGTRGLGFGMASIMAAYGASVVMTDLRKEDCERAQKELEDQGYTALGVVSNASKIEDTENMVKTVVEKFGHIDILVNNAGIGGVEKPIFETNEKEWDMTIDVDLKGVYFTSKIVALQMKEQGTGGRIVNLGSAAGIMAPKYTSAYAAAKSSVIHLTKVMANEWARYNINVNAIAPGYIITDMTKAVMADEKNSNAVIKKIALRRFGEVSDVAGVVLFLVTEASKYLTGVLIPIDGGMVIS